MKIYKKLVSQKDEKILANQRKKSNLTYFFDQDFFKNKVFVKPWGYEFLIFSNKYISIIILCLDPYGSTSFHCHPEKNTSITVLQGGTKVTLSNSFLFLKKNHSVDLGKGIFHKSSNLSNFKTILMEIETPTLKEDLLRFDDDYGRRLSGYNISDYKKLTNKVLKELNIKKINENKFRLNNKLILEYLEINDIKKFSKLLNQYDKKKSMILPIIHNKKYKITKMLYSLSKLSNKEIKLLLNKTSFFLFIGEKK
tara:strand:- start:102 stop:860 length:759 start_codon:yes stop_codon:yes gene_type:complete